MVDDSGHLDRRLRSSEIFVPARSWLSGASIHWKFVSGRSEPTLRSLEYGRELLMGFVRLSAASDKEIERFVKEWGPLAFADALSTYMRRRNIKASVSRIGQALFEISETVSDLGGGTITGHGSEPAEVYRSLANYIRLILLDAAEIHSGRVSRPEWEDRFPYHCETCLNGLEAAIDGVRRRVSLLVEVADVSLGLQSGPLFRVEVQYPGLLGALATQTLLASARSAGIWACNGCGDLYLRAAKPPKNTERNFCPRCTPARGPNKSKMAAKAAYRQNVRKARDMAAKGISQAVIAETLNRPLERIKEWIEKGVVT